MFCRGFIMTLLYKWCKGCQGNRQVKDFGEYKSRRDGLADICKKCHVTRQLKNWTKRRDRNRAIVLDYLINHPCVDCQISDVRVLHFDHIKGKKLDIISNMVTQARPVKLLKMEIAKCEVRCANCHTIKTALEQEWSKGSNIFDREAIL
jgi:hypothetical protein